MKNVKGVIQIVLILLTVVVSVMLGLLVFDAISIDTLKDSVSKLAMIALIAIASTAIITLVSSLGKK